MRQCVTPHFPQIVHPTGNPGKSKLIWGNGTPARFNLPGSGEFAKVIAARVTRGARWRLCFLGQFPDGNILCVLRLTRIGGGF